MMLLKILENSIMAKCDVTILGAGYGLAAGA